MTFEEERNDYYEIKIFFDSKWLGIYEFYFECLFWKKIFDKN